MLRYDLTREVAVAKSGAAVETVTSGPTVWSRAAMGVDGLEGRAWDVVPSPGPNQLGMAAVVDLVARQTTRGAAHRTLPGAT